MVNQCWRRMQVINYKVFRVIELDVCSNMCSHKAFFLTFLFVVFSLQLDLVDSVHTLLACGFQSFLFCAFLLRTLLDMVVTSLFVVRSICGALNNAVEAMFGENLGITGQNLSVSKSNQLHIVILHPFIFKLECIPQIMLN